MSCIWVRACLESVLVLWGPIDPHEHVLFVEKLLPQIDDVSPCLWAASLSHVQLPSGPFWPLGLLVLGPGIYALDNMLVTCSFGTHFQTSIYGICQIIILC